MKRTVLIDLPVELTNFLAMPEGVYKNIIYNRDIKARTYSQCDVAEENGKIFFSYSDVMVRRGTKAFFLKRNNKNGFTVNEKGKLSVWYRKQLVEIQELDKFLKHYKHDWLNMSLLSYITKGIFEKIMAGKITNNLDLIKAYIKVNHLKVSPALLLKHITNGRHISKVDILRIFSVAANLDHALEYYEDTSGNKNFHYLHDSIDQALILGRKINFRWSPKRMAEEHDKWTKDIMNIEFQQMQDEIVEWVNPLNKFTPKGFELLNSKKRIFEEGTVMSHCVYTNYWGQIRNKQYLVYHITLNDEKATVGYRLNTNGKISYHQCSSKRNAQVSDKLKETAQKFVDVLNKKAKSELEKLSPVINNQIAYE